jgi:galactose mutarotase-like enzyme
METTGVKFIMLYNGEYAENSYVAVEPMSSAIDSFNSGEALVVLKKGEVFETGFSVNASKI